jgi:hypothetical protein
MTIPHPKLNGGLYTGEPFSPDAPWATVKVVPDVDYMTNINLRSANPPPGAIYQYPGNTRPGNNHQSMPGVVNVPQLAQACVKPSTCQALKAPHGKQSVNNIEFEPMDTASSKWGSV